MTQVISIAQRKGGVAKTTTTIALAVELAKYGKNVLVIDLDDNPGLTYQLLTEAELSMEVTPDLSAYRLLSEPAKSITGLLRQADLEIEARDDLGQPRYTDDLKRAFMRTGQEHGWAAVPGKLHIIPGHEAVRGLERKLERRAEESSYQFNPEVQLRDALHSVVAAGTYDYVLIDTPPAKNVLMFNSLRAARWVICTLDFEKMSLRSLVGMRETIRRIASDKEQYQESPLELLGVLPVKYIANVAYHGTLMRRYRESLPDIFTDPDAPENEDRNKGNALVVPFDPSVGLASVLSVPPQFCNPGGPATYAYGVLARHLVSPALR